MFNLICFCVIVYVVFIEIVKEGMMELLKLFDFEIKGDVICKWFFEFYVVWGYKVFLSLLLVFDDLIVLFIIVGML